MAEPALSTVTVAEALAAAVGRGLDRLDAQLLLLHVIGKALDARAWLLAHDHDPLDAAIVQPYARLVERRLAGEPLAYLVGHKEFFGLQLRVDRRALVPRPDTEILVQWALDVLPSDSPTVLDLGTGSGAIALAVKQQRPDAQVTAVDFSVDALAVAQTNGQRLGLEVQWTHSDWFANLSGRFQVIASNPPYIRNDDPHLAALALEPQQALTSGADGLDAIRGIVDGAPRFLCAGGWLLLEHGYDQGAAVAQVLRERGFAQVQSRKDLAGIVRCTGARWQSAG